MHTWQWKEITDSKAVPKEQVAYNIINNQIAYVHPDAPNVRLPRGLFFVKSKENETIKTPRDNKLAVYEMQDAAIKNANMPYVYSKFLNDYVYWAGNQAKEYSYDLSKKPFIDPSIEMAKWREDENQRLGNAYAQLQVHVPQDPVSGLSWNDWRSNNAQSR